MKASEAEQRFEQSKRLYAEGRFAEALAILVQLDAAHPNDRHLLYPLALCLARVGRVAEARNVCDRLIREFNDPKAAALRRQLGEPAPPVVPPTVPTVPGIAGIPGLQPIDLGDLNAPVVKYTPPPEEPAWKKWLIYSGVALGAVAAVLVVTYVVVSIPTNPAQPTQAPESSTATMERLANMQGPVQITPAYVAVTILGLLLYPAVLFGVLVVYGKLPYDELWRNAGQVALVMYGLAAFQYVTLRLLSCCGFPITFLVTLGVVKRVYGLENSEVLFWYACNFFLNIIIIVLQVVALLY